MQSGRERRGERMWRCVVVLLALVAGLAAVEVAGGAEARPVAGAAGLSGRLELGLAVFSRRVCVRIARARRAGRGGWSARTTTSGRTAIPRGPRRSTLPPA